LFYYPDEDWYSKLDLAPDFPCQTTYSVELARPNQQFELVGCFDTLEDAKKELNRNAETKVLTPVIRRYDNKIIDMSSGYVNLGVVPITEIIGMYESETDRSYSTYTNGQFGYESLFVKSEVSEYGRVKIKLSGKMAWVKFETGDYHLELVPTSQILDSFEDISHYTVFVIDGNRELNHKFTHRNIFLNDISAIKLGFAPSFMEEDEKYYSFDGHYFYDDYLKMFKDAVLETNGNAINEEPYYNYYQYVTVRSESNYNGDDLDRYYEYRGLNRDSIMDGNGNYFIHAEQTTGINGAMEYAWAAHESAFGSSRIALDKNNLFGMGAYDGNPYEGSLAFDSVLEGVEYHAKRYLSIGYTDALSDSRYYGAFLGNKASGMNVLYASDPYWGEKIAAHYFRLDLLGGLQDYAKYDLVIKESNQVLKTLYSENGDIAYYTKNNHKDFQLSYQAFTLLGETEDYYLIASDMPIRISEKEVCLYTVFNTSTGLYDTIDTTSDVSIGKIGFACTYNFDNNILYLEKSIHLREVKEK
jgi:beta-N-acetylglucosaminidase